MKITVRYFDGCPNWEVADRRLREAVALDGLAHTEVGYERVDSPEEAERLRFRGSPTILIDGEDPWADPAAPFGLACRVYRTDAGAEGAPSMQQLRSALAAARAS